MKKLSRRKALENLTKMAAFSAFATGMPSLARAQASPTPVTTMGYGGAFQSAMTEAFLDPWSAATGIPFKYITPWNFSQLRAMHEAGQQEIDVVLSGNGLEALQLNQLGMTVPLDFSVVDKSGLSEQQLRFENGITALTLSTLFVFNKTKWPGDDHPKSWADFWDVTRYPGPRAMQRQARGALEAALMADGVPADPAQIYPLDVDRAFAKLDEIKPHVVFWWSSGSEPQQMIQDKEVDLCVIWNGRASESIIDHGAPYEIVWEQALYTGDGPTWFVLKGGPNPEGAMKFMDFVGRPEPQIELAKRIYYGPANPKAYDQIDAGLGEILPSYPNHVGKALKLDDAWWLEHMEQVTKRFELWLQG